jgi:hypothetical protein
MLYLGFEYAVIVLLVVSSKLYCSWCYSYSYSYSRRLEGLILVCVGLLLWFGSVGNSYIACRCVLCVLGRHLHRTAELAAVNGMVDGVFCALRSASYSRRCWCGRCT